MTTDPGSNNDSTIKLAPEEYRKLLEIEAYQKVKDRILHWALGLGGVLVIIGFLGCNNAFDSIRQNVSSTIQDKVEQETGAPIRAAWRAAFKAEYAGKMANAAVRRTRAKIDQLIARTRFVRAQTEQLRQAVRSNVSAINDAIEAERQKLQGYVDIDLESFRKRLKAVDRLLVSLEQRANVPGADFPRNEWMLYEGAVSSIETATKEQKQRFRENSQYTVTIYFHETMIDFRSNVVEELRKRGFEVISVPQGEGDRYFFADGFPVTTSLTSGPLAWFETSTIAYGTKAPSKARGVKTILAQITGSRDIRILEDEWLATLPGANDIQVLLIDST